MSDETLLVTVTESDVTEEANETPDEDLAPDDDQAEEPDEDEAAEDEEPEARVPSSQTILADRDRKLSSETRRHENALRKIYGPDFEELAVCPLCLSDGWIIPAPPGAFPDEQWEAVKMAAGQETDAKYEAAHHAERCTYCDGWGEVLSGSQNPTHRLVACPDCTGTGWRAKIDAPPPAPTFQIAPPPPNGAATIDWTRPRDQWDRPEGHPHFGMAPNLVGL